MPGLPMAVIHFVVLDALGLDHAARFEDFTNRADTINESRYTSDYRPVSLHDSPKILACKHLRASLPVCPGHS